MQIRYLLPALLLVCPWSAGATNTCTAPNTTYATLISYGIAGCRIGDFLFYGFQPLAASQNSTALSDSQDAALAAGINMSFSEVKNADGSRTVAMQFLPSTPDLLSAVGIGSNLTGTNGSFDFRPAFNVNVTPTDPSLGLLGWVGESISGRVTDNQPGTGNGGVYKSYITASETVTSSLGGASIHLSPTIIDTVANYLPYNPAGCFDCGGGGNDLSGTAVAKSASSLNMTNSSLPTGTVVVSKDILIHSGKDSNSFAALDSLTEYFTQPDPPPVPEPGEFLLMGTGLVTLFALRSRFRSRKS